MCLFVISEPSAGKYFRGFSKAPTLVEQGIIHVCFLMLVRITLVQTHDDPKDYCDGENEEDGKKGPYCQMVVLEVDVAPFVRPVQSCCTRLEFTRLKYLYCYRCSFDLCFNNNLNEYNY